MGENFRCKIKNLEIPITWAVDGEGNPTTNPHNVGALLPISGHKGYGLMMMVDILSGVLLGLPFGSGVSSMYAKLNEGRNLGQIFIAIDPSKFRDLDDFKKDISKTKEQLQNIKPAHGFERVYYPGETSQIIYEKYLKEGIPIEKNIYEYLKSETVHFDQYGGNQSAFASKK